MPFTRLSSPALFMTLKVIKSYGKYISSAVNAAINSTDFAKILFESVSENLNSKVVVLKGFFIDSTSKKARVYERI